MHQIFKNKYLQLHHVSGQNTIFSRTAQPSQNCVHATTRASRVAP